MKPPAVKLDEVAVVRTLDRILRMFDAQQQELLRARAERDAAWQAVEKLAFHVERLDSWLTALDVDRQRPKRGRR